MVAKMFMQLIGEKPLKRLKARGVGNTLLKQGVNEIAFYV